MAIYGTLGESSIGALDVSISGTAVDVFVYDTSQDSDGGAWRKRTQHTSWYSETLNTSTRGSRKEFPGVAIIVAESGKVIIYDGDDPDMPMWMEFTSTSGEYGAIFNGRSPVSVVAKNGEISVADSLDSIVHWNFIADTIKSTASSGSWNSNRNIKGRNPSDNTNLWQNYDSGRRIVGYPLNDLAITVLPNAPVDYATGLPTPTIAVATEVGGSALLDNGGVFDFGGGNSTNAKNMKHISIDPDRGIFFTNNSYSIVHQDIPTADYNNYINTPGYYELRKDSGEYPSSNFTDSGDPVKIGGNGDAFGNDNGITLFNENFESKNDSQVAYVSTSYNTGWMHGDIKGAFLSDTDDTNVTGSELITNGTFDSNVSSWVENDSTNTYSSGKMQITRTGGSGPTSYQAFTTEVGKTYVATAEINSSGSRGDFYIEDGTGWSGTTLGTAAGTNGQTRTLIVTFTAISTTTSFGFTVDTISTSIIVDNVSVTLGEPDLSVNDKALQVVGTVTKSAVATGAELVAYSGWGSSNYLDNTSYSVNFGNPSNISIIYWQKYTDIADYGYAVSLSEGNTVKGGISNGASGSSYPGQSYFNMGSTTLYTGVTTNDGNWHCLVGTIQGTNKKFYLDGRLVSSTAITNYDMSGITKIHVGTYGVTHAYAHRGSLALLRVSASVPSAEQIKKIYEDEKVLFQENAKCTLHGTSNAVTALGYDDSTNLLHVGTSSGRSDFQGLRRINNTTTAVTTAISASNGLVAEQ